MGFGTFAALLILVASGTANQATAQISVVVAASSSLTADKSSIADMFAGAKTTWPNGKKVQIVDQPDTKTGSEFYSKFLKQSIPQVRTQWTRLVLSGQALAPKKVANPSAMKRALSELPGSIGYIPTSELDSSVKEILRIES